MAIRLSSRLAIGGLATAALAIPIGIASADTHGTTAVEAACGGDLAGDPFIRTELFFGLSRPGGRISQRQFDRFVDDNVTPRFPDGLTLLSGRGQFRLADGDIVEEGSKVLVLLHEGGADRSAAIDSIRDEYVDQFDQQSVLRTDTTSCVGF
jgi:Protein of unknown function (DUF3574)